MKALCYNSYAPQGTVEYADLHPPGDTINRYCSAPALRGELVVQVHCISFNPVDWKILAGQQSLINGKNFPRVFGSDFSGVVISAGSNQSYREGQRVYGMVSPLGRGWKPGSGKEVLRVKAAHCLPIPDKMTFSEAAALPAAGISALLATSFADSLSSSLASDAQSSPSEHSSTARKSTVRKSTVRNSTGRNSTEQRPSEHKTALVIGASGGVGSMVTQVLAKLGWRVSVVCRSEHKDLLAKLGAVEFLDRDSWRQQIKNRRWSAIVDCPAALIRERPAQFLHKTGHYSPVYIPDDFTISQLARIAFWWPLRRSTGLFLAYPSKKRLTTLHRWVVSSGLRAAIDSVWPAEEFDQGLQRAKGGGFFGKIIVTLA